MSIVELEVLIMAKKDREKLKEIIDSIEGSDFDFKEVLTEGEIQCHDIKVIDYIDTDNKTRHKVTIPKITVSKSSWYDKDEIWDMYYDEKREVVEKLYDRKFGIDIDMNDEAHNSFKSTIKNVKYIKTEAKIMYATFSNKDKLEQIKKLSLFSSIEDRLRYGFKGWTGETFFETRFGPLFTERNKILNLVDCLSEYKEADKEKLVNAYKAFLHKELNELEKVYFCQCTEKEREKSRS